MAAAIQRAREAGQVEVSERVTAYLEGDYPPEANHGEGMP